MKLPRILKNFNLLVDGTSQAGLCDQVQLPGIVIKTEEHRGGGMDSPVKMDMGMEALDMEWTMAEYNPDVIRLVGLTSQDNLQLTFRAALDNEQGQTATLVVQARGKITEMNPDATTAGGKNTVSFKANLTYYRISVGGVTCIEIDIPNCKRLIGGRDQLAQMRAALAL